MTARFEIQQSLFFSFQWTLALLLKGCSFCIHAGLPIQGFQVPVVAGKLPLCLCRSGRAQQVLAQSLSLQVLPVAPALPKACAQPLPGLSVSVTIEGLLQTGFWDCSQERLQHSTDRSDFLRVCLFLFIPLCLPSLWPQPPWARNMANIKSGW